MDVEGKKGITGIILAGGKSTRFGRDKASFLLDGRPMIAHVHEAIRDVVDDVHVSGPAVAGLHISTIVDRFPGSGPLAGVHAALCEVETPWVFVVACDMPFLTQAVARVLVAARDADCRAVVAVTTDGRRQPLCACYHRSLRPLAEVMLLEQNVSMREFLTRIDDVKYVTVADEPLTNLNCLSDIDPDSIGS